MSKRSDLLYLGHMLDHARKVVSRVVHDDVNIDLDVVWQVATKRLPELIEQLLQFTPPEPPSA